MILSGVGVAYSAFSMFLQINFIHALCSYCLISGIITLLLLSTASWHFARTRKRSPNDRWASTSGPFSVSLSGIAEQGIPVGANSPQGPLDAHDQFGWQRSKPDLGGQDLTVVRAPPERIDQRLCALHLMLLTVDERPGHPSYRPRRITGRIDERGGAEISGISIPAKAAEIVAADGATNAPTRFRKRAMPSLAWIAYPNSM